MLIEQLLDRPLMLNDDEVNSALKLAAVLMENDHEKVIHVTGEFGAVLAMLILSGLKVIENGE